MKIAVLYTAKSDTLVNALATDAKRLLGEDTELLAQPVYSPLERPLEGIYRALVENGKVQ